MAGLRAYVRANVASRDWRESGAKPAMIAIQSSFGYRRSALHDGCPLVGEAGGRVGRLGGQEDRRLGDTVSDEEGTTP